MTAQEAADGIKRIISTKFSTYGNHAHQVWDDMVICGHKDSNMCVLNTNVPLYVGPFFSCVQVAAILTETGKAHYEDILFNQFYRPGTVRDTVCSVRHVFMDSYTIKVKGVNTDSFGTGSLTACLRTLLERYSPYSILYGEYDAVLSKYRYKSFHVMDRRTGRGIFVKYDDWTFNELTERAMEEAFYAAGVRPKGHWAV